MSGILSDDTNNMTEEEIHKFALEVFRRFIKYEGEPIDVSKLTKNYDPDELTYDPDSVINGD